MRDLDLPSGRKLHIQEADFQTSRALFEACMEEVKALKVDPEAEVDVNFLKDIFCTAVSSKKIMKCLWDCFKTVTINDVRVSNDSFEPVDARQDYYLVCWEVTHDNVLPFMKSHLPWLSIILGKAKDSLKSKPPIPVS